MSDQPHKLTNWEVVVIVFGFLTAIVFIVRKFFDYDAY